MTRLPRAIRERPKTGARWSTLLAIPLALGMLRCGSGPRELGLQWTKRMTVGHDLTGIAWSGTQFVAVGCCSVMTSPDGLAWQVAVQEGGYGEQVGPHTMPYQWQLERITWGGSQFVAVGYQTGARRDRPLIATSPDGATWTERAVPDSTHRIVDVAWSGHRFVAVGSAILTSTDGATWTDLSASDSASWTAVTWTGSLFIAAGGKALTTSPDGVTWTKRALPVQSLGDVAGSGDRLVAVAFDSIFTSQDGVTWSSYKPPLPGFWKAVTWSGSQFVAVGQHGIIVTSPDGITWTQRPAPRGMFSDVAWSGTRFVAVGAQRRGWFADYTVGLIVTSP
jgi:hypothetical protein